MSWLDPMEPDDSLAQLLTDWRAELDEHVNTVMSTEIPAPASRPRRWVRAHQRTATATAIVVLMAGSTTVAAAASGSSGPLGGVHDFLYGKGERTMPAAMPVDHVARHAGQLLDEVAARIQAAQTAGVIGATARAHLNNQLDRVQELLDSDEQAPAHLRDQLNQLRHELAAIPTPAPPAPVTPPRAHGDHGARGDDAGGDDNAGQQHDGSHSADDATHSGDDGQAQDRSGDSGSDDGTDSGSDSRGDGGSDGGGSDGGGSDDGGSDDSSDQSGLSGHRGDDSTSSASDQSDDDTTSGDGQSGDSSGSDDG